MDSSLLSMEVFMAFTATVTERTVYGNKLVHFGTYTSSGGDTGGNINTSMAKVEVMLLQPKGSAVTSNAPVVNETLPVAGNAVTIVTDANESGQWLAIGY